jgi:glycosyltransferase involved in cell wall biosynthesis
VRVLVATVAHRGDDARILFRQIDALLAAGIDVTYVSPSVEDPLDTRIRHVVVPRAVGRRRVGSWWKAITAIRRERPEVDLILVHDLELVVPIHMFCRGIQVVWDVHEDVIASVADRSWIPERLRGPTKSAVKILESVARRNSKQILAELSYRDRLGPWPIVPNSAVVAGLDGPAVRLEPPVAIYLGRISNSRGLDTMIRIGQQLSNEVRLVLIGPADVAVADQLRSAHANNYLEWLGPLPNPEALKHVRQAMVGLCLLRPLDNYVGSMPTKIYEYFAQGVPAIVTPLPLARSAVEDSSGGVVVGHNDVAGVVQAIRGYAANPRRATADGKSAHAWVLENHNWTNDGLHFVEVLKGWAPSE